MTEFAHSEVLFAGDDGLPIQFNIQYTIKKDYLKSIIEYGGGMCTLSDDAIYLVSPGTKVLNVDPSKTLVSTRYIFDCMKEDNLLDTDEYRIEINEMEASDFSDNSNMLAEQHEHDTSYQDQDDRQDSIDIIGQNKPSPENCANSNHDFDFEDSERNVTTVVTVPNSECGPFPVPQQSTRHHIELKHHVIEKSAESSVSAIPDSLDFESSLNMGQNLEVDNLHENDGNGDVINNDNVQIPMLNARSSPVTAVVSSSQEDVGDKDQFDNAVLNKLKEKPVQDEDSLSQSYTVSSSADAQVNVSPKQASHHTSAEIFDGSFAVPDSASQTTERQQYITNLEKEVEEILKKPSPKSIQDKIAIVKYICTVKKLAPAIVLKTLQNFQNV